MGFKSGFVSIIGRPNVGKSTLINAIMGEKISIISPKPQTTRNTIRAIYNGENCQYIFIDTPGIHRPRNKLGEYMVKVAENTLKEVDVCIFIVEATDERPGAGDLYIIDQLKNIDTPVILLINKIDLIKKEKLLLLIDQYNSLMNFEAIIPISALERDGIDRVIKTIDSLMKEGPKYFPDDIVTDQPERFMVAEIIREKILTLTHDEVPHGIGVEVISFKLRPDNKLVDIEVNIYCEKYSHKGILIGKQGSMLKRIGIYSREEIENLLGIKVNLQLWIKVKEDWRNKQGMLNTLGYNN